MLRKTGKQCPLRKAQKIRLEGMNVLTGVRDPGLLHGTRSEPEAELHLGHVEVMSEEIRTNLEGSIHATADNREADLHQFIPSEGIPHMHPGPKRMNYTSVQSVSLTVSEKSACTPALQKLDQRIKSIPEARTWIHGSQITILQSRFTKELTWKQ